MARYTKIHNKTQEYTSPKKHVNVQPVQKRKHFLNTVNGRQRYYKLII